LATIPLIARKQQTFMFANPTSDCFNAKAIVPPRNEIVPFEIVADLAIEKSIYQIDNIRRCLNVPLSNMNLRGMSEPTSDLMNQIYHCRLELGLTITSR